MAVARCEEASQINLGSRSPRRKQRCRLDVPGGPIPDEGRQQSASRGAIWGCILKALLVSHQGTPSWSSFQTGDHVGEV